ncbi:MAG: hypothetical protein LBJ21_04370 [Acidobacteriota bacterium]|nr:hypothetical protein [Acidobacteriota bacterium]
MTWGGKGYRLTFADTVTWMKGAHSFKGGAEFCHQQSYQDYTVAWVFIGISVLIRDPSAYGGMTTQTNNRRAALRLLGAANQACLNGTGESWCGRANGSTDRTSSLNGNFSTPYQMMTYAPMSATGNNALWSKSNPILVRPDLWDNKAGSAEVMWSDNGTYVGGRYFGEKYTNYALDTVLCDGTVQGYMQGPNPSSTPHSGLYSANCSNSNHAITGQPIPRSGAPRALALASGMSDESGNMLPALYESDYLAPDGVTYKKGTPIIVMRNADQRLGEKAAGNFSPNQLTGVGRLSFDMAMSKSVEFMEGKRIEVRVDAQNILNHATPSNSYSTYAPSMRNAAVSNPSLSLNSSDPFGYILTKVGRRTFQGRLRLTF